MEIMKYCVGYSMIDNYIYFVKIAYGNKIYVNEQKASIKKYDNNQFIIMVGGFEYNGTINNDNIHGIATIILDGKRLSSGKFIATSITKSKYEEISKYMSSWDWLTHKLTPIKPKIYEELKQPLVIINVMSFNICSTFVWTGDDGIQKVANIIKKYDTDIVLLQEINEVEFNKLVKLLNKSTKYYGEYKGGIITKYKINNIYNRTEYSPIYGVKIKVNKDISIRVFNSHLEDGGYYNIKYSKYYQLPHLLHGLYNDVYVKKNNPELASIIAGDHNIVSHLDEDKQWPVSKQLYEDGWIDTFKQVNKSVIHNSDATFPNCDTANTIIKKEIGFQVCKIKPDKSKHRIDYIYTKNGKNVSLKPIESVIINKYDNGKWPSDHNAVFTKLLVML